MRLLTGRWIVAAGLAVGTASGAWAAAVPIDTDEPVRVNTLSGAYLAARIAESDNELDAAIAYYRRALAFDPDNRTVQQSLLLGLISQGRFDEALPFAEKLKEVPEVERFSRLALGVDAIRQGKYGDADYWLKLSLESDLDRLITGLMAAWAKLGDGKGEDALAALDALAGPEWYELFITYHRALIAEQAGEVEAARAAFEAGADNLSAAGAAPETHLRLLEAYAGFLARKGERDAAFAVMDKADAFAPGRLTIQALRGRIEGGRAAPPLVPDAKAGAAEALLNLATALNRSGGESFVRLYLNYALALLPHSDAVLIQLAGVSEQQGDAEGAIAFYEKIPAASPMKRVAELQLGLNLADLKRHDEAISHLKAALAKDEGDMRAYLSLGGVYASQENYRAAADIYERAVARIEKPVRTDWNIFYQRGIAYERLKEWDKAEPNFRTALELFPDQPQVLNYLGYSWVDMNINLDEGLELIQRAVDLRPSDGYIVDSLGWAFYRLGRYEDAVRELERAVGLMPADPILNDHLGDAYWRVGRRLEAGFQWNHALALDPEPDLKAEVEKKIADGLPSRDEEAQARQKAEAELPPNAVPLPEGVDGAKAEAAPEVETVSAGAAVHTVLPGQSLWSIAAEILGDGNRYIELLDLNPALRGDPGRIVPGQRLTLPQPGN
ncbi:MAG: tetratricopeptide repeat protein [Aquamicrobium sp.]|uniref:tetratricopeptide repeat protein n=1 Tax=Aquamicrobium sp. TaxID=1872579 RepID=UPI00349E8C05|nr:tetratricopeptide repeat protein [Aquamicrobium sp.]